MALWTHALTCGVIVRYGTIIPMCFTSNCYWCSTTNILNFWIIVSISVYHFWFFNKFFRCIIQRIFNSFFPTFIAWLTSNIQPIRFCLVITMLRASNCAKLLSSIVYKLRKINIIIWVFIFKRVNKIFCFIMCIFNSGFHRLI